MPRRRAQGAEALFCSFVALFALAAARAQSVSAWSRSQLGRSTSAFLELAIPSAARYSRTPTSAEGATLQFNGARAFDDLKHVVAFGPRPPGSTALAASREWIIKQLRQDGCDVEQDSFVAATPVGQIPMTNVIAKIPGAKPDVIMMAGHYDTMRFENGNFVGANDGGSSTAFLLEMARLLAHRKGPATYWLVFFDGEEALVRWSDSDKLYGSRHLVQRLSSEGELSRIKAMILVDMIADAKLDIHRESNSTAWLGDIVFNTADRLGYSKFFLKSLITIDDDHIPFVDAGVSAVDVIDLDYGPNNSYHHTLQDTIDKCSPASLAIVGRVVVATLAEIENFPNIKH
jgi:Zn-dependent M28 family amino/carboxypeptidase